MKFFLTLLLTIYFVTTTNASPVSSNLTTRADEQSDSDSGCVTKDGRPGTCVVRAACNKGGKGDDLVVCYKVPGFFMEVEFVCCPDTDKPGVVPPFIKGMLICNYRAIINKHSFKVVVSDRKSNQSLEEAMLFRIPIRGRQPYSSDLLVTLRRNNSFAEVRFSTEDTSLVPLTALSDTKGR